MKSENKHFKTRRGFLSFCKKILEKNDGEVLLLGDKYFVDDIQKLQQEEISNGMPIEEDIECETNFDVALVSEEYLELVKNYTINNNLYIISCDEVLNSEITPNIDIKNSQEYNYQSTYDKEDENTDDFMDVDEFIEMKLNEILSKNGCPECIRNVLYSVFASGMTTEKNIQLIRLQEELGYLNGNDENGEDYLN
jgi:hypothetical protein